MSSLFRSKAENQIDETRRPRNLIKSARRHQVVEERGKKYGRGHNFDKKLWLKDKEKYEKKQKAEAKQKMVAKRRASLQNAKQKVI